MAAALLLAVVLVGCGFKPVGQASMPFETLYVTAPSYSSLGAEFRRYVESGGKTRVVDQPEKAQVILEITSETQEQQILSALDELLSLCRRVRCGTQQADETPVK